MICCDGEKCSIVWYHADLVGLSIETVPAGSWFCKDCTVNTYWYLSNGML